MSPSPEQKKSYKTVDGMYAEYFMDYASYVILERAVPHINDGLKPVQRRILHSMERMDDGRFNKVANIVGDTMKYHPHGDASIGDALVGIGQKKLLVDTQGNWGNILTGDPAAASRYIEARLTAFAKDVVYSPKVTEWQLSYDGRNKEPVTFPIKFPLLLAQGAEGIAVGLACKILPHNFNELIDAAIAHLRGEDFTILPDFPTGGIMDASDYRDGDRGAGRVRIRAKIEIDSKKLIRVTEVPFGVCTDKLIESIISASEKGKIKIAKIEDNTAKDADILVHLAPGSDPEQIKQALFAFTDCEVSISPNACVIKDNKPHFMGVSDILRHNTDSTKNILRMELEVQLAELQQDWHKCSLEKIFIENRIYLLIENCETWESVLQTIADGLKPFLKNLKGPVTQDDIAALTEIKIKRISKFDSFKAEENLKKLEDGITQTEKNLSQLTRYTIRWFEGIKKKYGTNFPRKTTIESFGTVHRATVAAATETLSIDEEGFAGYGIKKGAPICKCSTLDDVIVIDSNGVMKVTRIQEKFFAAKNPLYINILRKDEDPVFNLIYRDGRDGALLAKRFRVGGFTRDREYPITQGTKGSRIFHFSVHETEEDSAAISLNIFLKAILKLRNLQRPYHFAELKIKNRNSLGNIVTKHQVERVSRIMNAAKQDENAAEGENSAITASQEGEVTQPKEQASTTAIPETTPPLDAQNPIQESPDTHIDDLQQGSLGI